SNKYDAELESFVEKIGAAALQLETLVKNTASPEDRKHLAGAFDRCYPEIQEKLSQCVGFISAMNDMQSQV
ncbi:MAG: hypothetical protein AAFW68_10905, partial [Pseudomonadota bacterium]